MRSFSPYPRTALCLMENLPLRQPVGICCHQPAGDTCHFQHSCETAIGFEASTNIASNSNSARFCSTAAAPTLLTAEAQSLWSHKLASAACNGIQTLKWFWLSKQVISQDNPSSTAPDACPRRLLCCPSLTDENCSVVQLSWALIFLSEKGRLWQKIPGVSETSWNQSEITIFLIMQCSCWRGSAIVSRVILPHCHVPGVCQTALFNVLLFIRAIKEPKQNKHDTNNNVNKKKKQTSKKTEKTSKYCHFLVASSRLFQNAAKGTTCLLLIYRTLWPG